MWAKVGGSAARGNCGRVVSAGQGDDDGLIVAIRYGDWKVVFYEQRSKTMLLWAEPFVARRLPKIFNLRRDPFERADQNSNSYWDWVLEHIFVTYPTCGLRSARSARRDPSNPPGQDSWIWLRDGASPFMDDFMSVGALDDGTVDWADNANLMELRMRESGIDVRNEVFPIPHLYKDQVDDLILSVQLRRAPTTPKHLLRDCCRLCRCSILLDMPVISRFRGQY